MISGRFFLGTLDKRSKGLCGRKHGVCCCFTKNSSVTLEKSFKFPIPPLFPLKMKDKMVVGVLSNSMFLRF